MSADANDRSWVPNMLDGSQGLAVVEPNAYCSYQSDFGPARPPVTFRDSTIIVNRSPHPANRHREHTYWHMVTEGHPETVRTTPMLDRLQRVPWARPLLEHIGQPGVKAWANVRGPDRHFCVWHDRINYIVVVKQTANAFLLKTTYQPTSARCRKLHTEYAEAKRNGMAF